MENKTCWQCAEIKHISQFYRNKKSKDGLLNNCKECNKRQKQGKPSIISIKKIKRCAQCKQFLNYDNYSKHKGLKSGLQSYCKNCESYNLKTKYKDKKAATQKKYFQNNREKYREYTRRYAKKNKKKRQAHSKLAYALRKGLCRIEPCEICGSRINIEAHHKDYSKPLEVTWLCKYHHKQWHLQNGQGINGH